MKGTTIDNSENGIGVELPSELLEGVSGGVLTDGQRYLLNMFIKERKERGVTLDEALAELKSAPASNAERNEMMNYVYAVWRSSEM